MPSKSKLPFHSNWPSAIHAATEGMEAARGLFSLSHNTHACVEGNKMIRHLQMRFLIHSGEIAQIIAAAALHDSRSDQRGLRPALAVNDNVRAMRVPFVDKSIDRRRLRADFAFKICTSRSSNGWFGEGSFGAAGSADSVFAPRALARAARASAAAWALAAFSSRQRLRTLALLLRGAGSPAALLGRAALRGARLLPRRAPPPRLRRLALAPALLRLSRRRICRFVFSLRLFPPQCCLLQLRLWRLLSACPQLQLRSFLNGSSFLSSQQEESSTFSSGLFSSLIDWSPASRSSLHSESSPEAC